MESSVVEDMLWTLWCVIFAVESQLRSIFVVFVVESLLW